VLQTLYTLSIALYGIVIRLAAPFHPKARLLVRGRRRTMPELREWNRDRRRTGPVAWFHCASLGEFEQGRPVIEALLQQRPDVQVVLTFFSPSGFEIRKNYPHASLVCYLPADLPAAAHAFVAELNPDLAVFIKYEYWPHFFFALKQRKTPLFIVSGIFREGQRFFGWQRAFWIKVLGAVRHFHLQNDESARLLGTLGITACTVAGDTRYDRVLQIAQGGSLPPQAAAFCGRHRILVVGSSYESEERIAAQFLESAGPDWKVIIAPHHIDASRIASVIRRFGSRAVRWTEWKSGDEQAEVLIVDTIGQLSAIYRCGHMALIGGAFGGGLHNTLEAAVYGIPVAFGPAWTRFGEAKALLEAGAAYSGTEEEVTAQFLRWSSDEDLRQQAGKAAKTVVEAGRGAVDSALALIFRALETKA
jgi:3-deoxy-D-manno-octulosonic-acid transferase